MRKQQYTFGFNRDGILVVLLSQEDISESLVFLEQTVLERVKYLC